MQSAIGPVANVRRYSIRSSIVGSAQCTSSTQTTSGRLARPAARRAGARPKRPRRSGAALAGAHGGADVLDDVEPSSTSASRPVSASTPPRSSTISTSGQNVMPVPYERHRPMATDAWLPSSAVPLARAATCRYPQADHGDDARAARRTPAPGRERQPASSARGRRAARPPAGVARRGRVDVLEPERLDRLALPLDAEAVAGTEPARVLDQRVGRRADQDLPRLRRLLQSLRHVHGVTRDEGLARARVPGDDLAGVDPDPAFQLHPPRS